MSRDPSTFIVRLIAPSDLTRMNVLVGTITYLTPGRIRPSGYCFRERLSVATATACSDASLAPGTHWFA